VSLAGDVSVQASRYLSIDELEVAGEEEVGAAALSWLHACPCDRQSDIFALVSSLRLEYLDPSYMQHRILDDQVGWYSRRQSARGVLENSKFHETSFRHGRVSRNGTEDRDNQYVRVPAITTAKRQ